VRPSVSPVVAEMADLRRSSARVASSST
jgi:hypothetical protein